MKRITSFLLAMVLLAGLMLTEAPVVHAASQMTASDALVEYIKSEEGFAAKPYKDYSQYSVGYGTRCPDDMLEEYSKNGISEEAAETLLRNYLAATENTINKNFIDAYHLSLTQAQFDALISFTYNCGSGWIREASGIFHNAVKSGATGSELIRAFSLWCSAGKQILPGLVRRRLCEANMFLNGVYSNSKPGNYGYVYYNGNGGSVSYRIQGYDANEGVAPAYTPTYAGHTFSGWYTDKTGGTKVTTLTMDVSGKTLYARWDAGEEEQPTAPEGGTTAATGVTIKVTGTDVNLRKGPGTNYSIVGRANVGDEMVVTETADGTGYTWGKAGEKWIALKYTNYDAVIQAQTPPTTETTPDETTTPETTVTENTVPETTGPETTVTETTIPEPTVAETTAPAQTAVTGTVKANGGLALRKGPGTGYARIRYLPNGSKVTVQEQQTVGSMTWGNIGEGWISMRYVVLDQAQSTPETTVPETTAPETTTPETTAPETTAPETTAPETTAPETTAPETTAPEQTSVTGKVRANGGLAVRGGAGTTYAVKQYLSNGSKVTITEVKDVAGTKWGKISNGWICMDYVVLDGQTSNTDSASTKTVTADCLRVRETAGTSSKIVGYYYTGAKVEILQTQMVGSVTWGKTAKGWISLDYVK